MRKRVPTLEASPPRRQAATPPHFVERGRKKPTLAPLSTCGALLGWEGLGVGTILSLLLLLTGCTHHAAPKNTAEKEDTPAALPVVQTAPVTVGEVTQTVKVTGTLAPVPNHEARISPPFAGKLAQVSVQLNQNIVKNQIVAQMSTQTLLGQQQQAEATIAANQAQVQQARINALQSAQTTRTAIAQAQATLAGSEATLANAKQNLERQRKLFADGLVAQKDVDDARTAVQTAEATTQAQRESVQAARAGTLTDLAKRQDIAIALRQVENARGALTTARSQIALATLRSPLSGVVATVTANNGETLDTSATIATIVDTRDLQLTISVPSRSLRLVHRGQIVEFTTESLPGRTFAGRITSLGAQVDPTTGTIPVQVHIPNPSHLLRDDMTAVGKITVARHMNALLLPKKALLTDPTTEKASVVIVGADGAAHVRPVTPSLPSGESVEITQGVKAGEQVAVSGQYGLPDGAKVSVANGR